MSELNTIIEGPDIMKIPDESWPTLPKKKSVNDKEEIVSAHISKPIVIETPPCTSTNTILELGKIAESNLLCFKIY